MARNLPVAFAAIIGGGVLVDAAIKGASIGDVIKGQAQFSAPTSNGGSGGSSGSTGAVTSKSGYINPLQHVTTWERTDQGVDASMPAGAPILAPGKVKIMGVIPDWYSGQPLVWWQLLDGPDAGKYQYVAEQITNIAGGGQRGTIVNQGQPIARFASSGTGIEFGWATASGQTLAKATTGYAEGEVTAAGRAMRQWLNSLGAGAGPS